MTPKFTTPFALIVTGLMMSQCVPSQDLNTLDLRIRNLDSRIVKMDQTLDKFEGAGQNNPIERLQRTQAELADKLDLLNTELLQLKGQVEESNHYYAKSKDDRSALKSTMETKVTELSQQILLLTDHINQISSQLEAVKTENATARQQIIEAENRAAAAQKEAEAAKEREKAAPAKPTGPREIAPNQTKLSPAEKATLAKTPDSTTSQESDTDAQGPGKEIYDQALSLFRAGKFNEAYRTFTEYIEKYPQGKMAPNSRFWLGDCYYSQQEYELAILEYQKVIADYPNHAKAPAALLKQGLAFEKLKDNQTAKIVYRKLLEDYPKSEQVETVKKRLEALK